MNLRKLRREHTLIFAHTASSTEIQGGFAGKTIRDGTGRVGSGRVGSPRPTRGVAWRMTEQLL